MRKYIARVSIAFSILINTLIGGKNNQTFSARNWQRKRDGKFNIVFIIDLVFFDRAHCVESWIKWTIINDAIKQYDDKMGFDHRKRKHWYEK